MPVDHRIFKPAALSKAIASVFVCGALVGTCGQAWALEADDATFKLMRTGEVGGEVMPAMASICSGLDGCQFSLNGAMFAEITDNTGTDTLTFDHMAPTSYREPTWNFDIRNATFTSDGGGSYTLPNLKNMYFVAKDQTIFTSLAADGGTGSFVNSRDGTILLEGGSSAGVHAWDYLANGGAATVENSGGGTLIFRGGSATDAHGLYVGVRKGGIFTLTNSLGGTVIFEGGFGDHANGAMALKKYSESQLYLSNMGTLIVRGGSGLNSYGIKHVALDTHMGDPDYSPDNEFSPVDLGGDWNKGTIDIRGGVGESASGIYYAFFNATGERFDNGGKINVCGGEGSRAYGIDTLVIGGTGFRFANSGTLNVEGSNEKENGYGISTLASNSGSLGVSNMGTINITGGNADYASGVQYMAKDNDAKVEVNNDEKITIKGGAGNGSSGVNCVSCSPNSIVMITNAWQIGSAVLNIVGGNGTRSTGMEYLAYGGGNAKIENYGQALIQGGYGDHSYGIATVVYGSVVAAPVIRNGGNLTISGGTGNSSQGISTLFADGGQGSVSNLGEGDMTIIGGSGQSAMGIGAFVNGAGAVGRIDNTANLTIQGGTGPSAAGIQYLCYRGQEATIDNKTGGTLTIQGGQSGQNGIVWLAYRNTTATIENAGTFNLFGTKGGASGIGTMANNATANLFNRTGAVLNVNRNGFGVTATGETGKFNFVNEGTVNADAEVFFEGYDREVVTQTPLDIIVFTPESQTTKTVQLDSYKQTDTSYVPDWRIRQDWLDPGVSMTWTDGGTLTITNIADGTEDARKIREAFEAKYGKGTTLTFTGTSRYEGATADTRATTYPDFTISHVNELIVKGDLVENGIVTSETLTHKDAVLTLGTEGDLKQNVGFKGIKDATGIAVKDGKTLTLMGKQADMAATLGTSERAPTFVITDSTMALTNGNLNLGHKALSATEGTLADVTFDRMSTVNVENGIYTLASLKGEGTLNLNAGTRTDVTGELSATQVTNAGTLTVAGLTSLGATPEAASTYAAPRSQTFVNESGATANLTGGLVVNDFATVKNKTGATITAGAVTVDTFGTINNYEGATLAYASVNADGIVRNLGTLNVTGTYAIGDEGETTFAGDTKVGTLSIGRTAKTMLMARDGQEAVLHNTGKTYADELDLVSGQVMVEKDSILAGKSLKNGAVGSDIIVSAGGTFGFSHDKSSLENALKNYTGSKADKAILALNTDLHFGQGGSLTVGAVDEAKGTVNLGSDALLLLGTTQLHGEALLNGESSQHLHVEDGAVIAMTDDLLWGNHYLMKGFDDASTAEILKVGILDKDGKALGTKKNDKGIFVTVGSDNILEKDKSYRMVNQMNWLLDGRQDLTSEHGDVAFLTSALVDKHGASATNRMEALAADSSAMAETQRMGAQVQTTMLDHASSARKGYGTFWVDGIYSKTDSGDFTRSTGAYDYEADTTGFAFGADLPMGDDTWRLGAAFSAQRGDLDGSYGLSSDIEGYGFSVYGGKTFSTGLNLSGALTYMTANHEVDAYNLGKVKADIDADMWVLGARMSMPFGQNRVWMTPYLGVDVMKLTQDGFTSSWSGMEAFRYSDVDATIVRTPVGVRAGTFMPLELFGRSGTVNWDADISFIPQFGDKDADFKVSGISNGHSDGMSAEFVNDWLSQAKFGMSYQGAAGSFGLYYAVEKGDVRDWSSSVNAKASLFF